MIDDGGGGIIDLALPGGAGSLARPVQCRLGRMLAKSLVQSSQLWRRML